MDNSFVKTNRTGPFPGSLTIPEKLRKLLYDAGIQPTEEGRIPWVSLPNILHEKSLYLSGLPTKLFFPTDKPSPQEVAKRVEEPLKWPPPGLPNPLRMLKEACDKEGNLQLLPRPPNKDIVFRVISEDGTSIEIGKWRNSGATKPRIATTAPAVASTQTRPVLSNKDSNAGSRTLSAATAPKGPSSLFSMSPTPERSQSSNSFLARHPQPTTSFEKAIKNSVPTAKKPDLAPKAAAPPLRPTPAESTSQAKEQLEMDEPFPKNVKVPLILRQLLKKAGVKESVHRGFVAWSSVPHVLWENGWYLTGIPSMAILEAHNPSTQNVATKMSLPFAWRGSGARPQELLKKAADRGEIKLLRRPEGRNVVFKVTTAKGPLDLGRWNDGSRKNEEKQAEDIFRDEAESSEEEDFQSTRSHSESHSSFDDDQVLFPRTKNVFVRLLKIFDNAGVRESKERPGSLPWASIPHVLWRNGLYISGLRAGFVLGNEDASSVTRRPWNRGGFFNQPSDEKRALHDDLEAGRVQLHDRPEERNVVFEVVKKDGSLIDVGKWETRDVEMNPQTVTTNYEVKSEFAGPAAKWNEEVIGVMDELADVLIKGGVRLPLHPSRPNAYQIPWSILPKLLRDARATLVGWPLHLLPFKKDLGKLNGKWTVRWNRLNLDTVKELLDYDGLAVRKWRTGDPETVVQAIDENKDSYDYTYDHFLTAEYDDPEITARDGELLFNPAKRKWEYGFDDEDRDIKRRRNLYNRTNVTLRGADVSATGSLVTTSERGSEIPERSRYWEAVHPDLPIPELNRKYARQKEIIRSLIAILLYYNIPCIAPQDEDCAFFLPWRNLPRHLAARNRYISGFPASCSPWVDRDLVVPESSPAHWGDDQWDALEEALEKNEIDLVKTQRKVIFELVHPDGKRELSVLQFSRSWIQCNFSTELGQSVSVFAGEVLGMDPIVEESDSEDDSSSMEIEI